MVSPMPFTIDTSSDFGRRAERRLRETLLAWLVTVDRRGTPQPVPVWFLWEGDTVLLYSRPGKPKLRNIDANPRVSLHLDGDGRGGDIVVVTGSAAVTDDVPASQVPAYVAKYAGLIEGNGWTPDSFAADYSVPMRITVERLRGH
jgi:PPOX class probable F420-dependent enzyme